MVNSESPVSKQKEFQRREQRELKTRDVKITQNCRTQGSRPSEHLGISFHVADRIPRTRPAAGANSATLSTHAPAVETGSKQAHCARGEAGGLGTQVLG